MPYILENLYVLSVGAIIALTGIGFAYLYGRNTKQFSWREYTALLMGPSLAVLLHSYFIDIKILYLYVVSAVVGFLLEFLLGFLYHQTLNRKLWTYDTEAYAIWNGYTSLLTFPMWGIAGVVFWHLSKIVGL